MNPNEALNRAVEVLDGQTRLAQVIGGNVRQQHVYNWLNRDGRLPAQHALKVEKATSEIDQNCTVYAFQLRPDVFPIPEENNA